MIDNMPEKKMTKQQHNYESERSQAHCNTAPIKPFYP
jgi:hypothetical protein